jgi:predicted  nucleic acid-binding Zn-ribbon protein
MAVATEVSIEQKLKALYKLQVIDTKIDKLRAVRGELPMEVADLEDDIAGLNTRQENIKNEVANFEDVISTLKNKITDAKALKKKYEKQLENVKNNREYEALNKEIEITGLEILAAEKKIKNTQFEIEQKKQQLDILAQETEGRQTDLNNKQAELKTITDETEKEEQELMKSRNSALQFIEERLLHSYEKIRASVKNGLGIASIMRDSCSGCFSKIPPQRQLDIKQRKKIIVCEHCGRVLVDQQLADETEL